MGDRAEGAAGASLQHLCSPTAPPGPPVAGGMGQGCTSHWVQRAQWVLAVSTQLSSHGKVEATLVAAGGLCGSVEPVPDAQEGVEPLSATVPLHGHQQPQYWGAAVGAPCAGRHSPAPFSHHTGGPWVLPGAGTGLEKGSGPTLPEVSRMGWSPDPSLGLLLWVPGVQLASSLWVAVGTDRPLISQLLCRAQAGGSRKSP